MYITVTLSDMTLWVYTCIFAYDLICICCSEYKAQPPHKCKSQPPHKCISQPPSYMYMHAHLYNTMAITLKIMTTELAGTACPFCSTSLLLCDMYKV